MSNINLDVVKSYLNAAGGSINLKTAATTTSSGAGAVSIAGSIHEITTTGTGDAMTLANGSVGQHLFIVYAAAGAGGDTAILTPTSFLSGATLTFNNVGAAAHLVYCSGGWVFLGGAAVVA